MASSSPLPLPALIELRNTRTVLSLRWEAKQISLIYIYGQNFPRQKFPSSEKLSMSYIVPDRNSPKGYKNSPKLDKMSGEFLSWEHLSCNQKRNLYTTYFSNLFYVNRLIGNHSIPAVWSITHFSLIVGLNWM